MPYFFSLLFSGLSLVFYGCDCLGTPSPAHSMNPAGEAGWMKTSAGRPGQDTILLIFETDIGNDVDDAIALDLLYKYRDLGRVKLLAISSNKDNPYSGRYVRLMNHWYGYPDLPIGVIRKGPDCENDSKNYAQAACEYRLPGSSVPAFRKELGTDTGAMAGKDDFMESTALYRRMLAAQPDHSVVIVSVGFSTNLARLLETKGDQYSALSGRQLVSRKVKLLSMMAGNFEGKRMIEYNVMKDVEAARKVFTDWPGPLVTSPFEVGSQVIYPATAIETGFSWAKLHPLVIAYKSYLPMPYDRPCWDPTAVLYAVEGASWFRVSKPGFISVDNQGYTNFVANPAGNHRYLEISHLQADRLRNRIIQLTTTVPASRK